MALTEREKQILRLKKCDMSHYMIARKLRVDSENVSFKINCLLFG